MKISKLGLRRAFAATAVAAVAAVGLSSLSAGGAAAEALPNGFKKVTGVDGQVVQIWRTGEYAFAQPSTANNGAGRSVRVSGTYTATVNKGGGDVEVGYLVGCQVSVTGLDAGVSGSLSASSASVGGSISFPLAPGEIKKVYVDDNTFTKDKHVMSIQLSGTEIDVQGCAGYAQARSYVKVLAANGYNTDAGAVNGSSGAVQATLYGKPFSLG
ncbi:hypothetical protein HH308_04940 [Gordonia sp. TBRC 11910]|uniref:MspA protein n=1 Tax=Gordonia asplenii TaxID=2725283 RepID=A0A848KQE7_9ACTN|nr:MspA family porin [Gordonia asplenii]NMO00560.1 hypothetical protein [Gordonia asplenii]